MQPDLRTVAAAVIAAGIATTPLAYAQPDPPAPPTAQRSAGRAMVIARAGSSYLGIGVVDVDSERAKALNLKEERGVEIKSVTPDSPASKAGLKEGDVVLDYNGQPVEGTEQFQRLVRETPAGRQVKLTVFRGGATQTLNATIATRKGAYISGAPGVWSFNMPEIPPIPPMPDIPKVEMSWRNAILGIEGESVSSQLAEFFGVKEGVLVRSVLKNSAAEKAGLKAGDVITRVDDSNVTSAREISSILRGMKSKKTFPVVLVRNRKEMTLTVTLEERTTGSGTRARVVWYGGHPLAQVVLPQVVVRLPEIRLPEIHVHAHADSEI